MRLLIVPSGCSRRSASSDWVRPRVVGELDRFALLGGEAAQGVLDDLAARARDDRFVGARVGALRLADDRRCAPSLLTANEIDGAPVHEREQPRARLRALGPVRAGGAPDLEERLLDGVLSECCVLEDLVREPVGDLAEAVVELAERVLVGAGDGFDELLVRALRAGPAHRLLIPGGAEPHHGDGDRALSSGGHVRSLPP